MGVLKRLGRSRAVQTTGGIAAAEDLRFEYAAQVRDELRELRRDLQEMQDGAPEPAAEAAGGDIA